MLSGIIKTAPLLFDLFISPLLKAPTNPPTPPANPIERLLSTLIVRLLELSIIVFPENAPAKPPISPSFPFISASLLLCELSPNSSILFK